MQAQPLTVQPRQQQRIIGALLGLTILILLAIALMLFLQKRDNEQRRERATRDAYHIAIGLVMYGQDYDTTLPPASLGASRIQTLINPYVKWGVGPAFRYTFRGGAVPINKGTQVQLGYVPGPGGRAVIYADGRVEWQGTGRSL